MCLPLVLLVTECCVMVWQRHSYETFSKLRLKVFVHILQLLYLIRYGVLVLFVSMVTSYIYTFGEKEER